MTDEEALQCFEDDCWRCRQRKSCERLEKSGGSPCRNINAMFALRDRIARQNPQPLTLEELCGMDGEPVWLKDGIGEGWFLTSAVVGSKIYFCEKSITIGEPISECGKTWLAYRHKPKEEHHEAN